MSEQEKRSESLAIGARVSVWIGAIVCAGIFWCVGMAMGIKYDQKANEHFYETRIRPVVDAQERDIRKVSGELRVCLSELTSFQVSTGFASAAERDAFIRKIMGEKAEAVTEAAVRARKDCEDSVYTSAGAK